MEEEIKKVYVDAKAYDKLQERNQFLCALEAAGVNNWEGFSVAHEMIEEWDKEDNEEKESK